MASSKQYWCFLLFLSIITLLFCSAKSCEQPSPYEVLEAFEFPRGLLPTGHVETYTLSPHGDFVFNFSGSGSFRLESGHTIKYGSQIKGQIQRGSIKKLKGVSVKILGWWAAIDEVIRKGDQLEIHTGIFSTSVHVSYFHRSPKRPFDDLNSMVYVVNGAEM